MTYGNDSLYGGVAKQRFACEAQVTLSNSRNDDDDGRVMQFTVALSITAAAAAGRQAHFSVD